MFSALSIKKSAKSEDRYLASSSYVTYSSIFVVNFQQICPPSRSSVLSIDKVR
ncbi:hypothetical protein SLEP1_g50708 [Rubroshorea leprosula]|uniref:Uncharacterized protein n=1 Tax=Rubroshorea leprosula TaxID=152421 RepID=A0AAV5M0W1_9ROSI|nr:hypothetical protein SLEP1_g50708 [Rubroshorea leprosula]